MEWFALIIPAITSALILKFWKDDALWWEFLLIWAISPIVIILCKFGAETSVTKDKEYWGSYIVNAKHYEAWDEEVPCTHAKYRTETYTDSNGKTQSREVFDGYEHLYDVDYHPEHWRQYDNIGQSFSISENTFNVYCKRWDNKKFKDMHRNYHSIDGDSYETIFDRKDEHLEPITTIHSYKNKVQASSSVFNFQEVLNPQDYGLYDYPDGETNTCILGSVNNMGKAHRNLQVANAKLGDHKQVKIWFLIFKGKGMDVGVMQESYWKGGNKNELVVCIGTDKENNVTWCRPFTWCEVDELPISIRNRTMEMKQLDMEAIVDYTVEITKKKWIRKEFTDFDYLEINLPSWTHALIWTVTLLVNIGIALFIIKNQHKENKRRW